MKTQNEFMFGDQFVWILFFVHCKRCDYRRIFGCSKDKVVKKDENNKGQFYSLGREHRQNF